MEKILGFFEKKNGFIISLIVTVITGFLLQLFGFILELYVHGEFISSYFQ
ncbi:MAG: hypothetical protein ACTSPQ_19920 [Candidatus Helarchaeota archaeon]